MLKVSVIFSTTVTTWKKSKLLVPVSKFPNKGDEKERERERKRYIYENTHVKHKPK